MIRLTEANVRKLFGYQSYDLKFNEKSFYGILTGDNGTGKSTILSLLSIVFATKTKNFEFLFNVYQKLYNVFFESVTFKFDNGLEIKITISNKKLYNNYYGERYKPSYMRDYFCYIINYNYNGRIYELDMWNTLADYFRDGEDFNDTQDPDYEMTRYKIKTECINVINDEMIENLIYKFSLPISVIYLGDNRLSMSRNFNRVAGNFDKNDLDILESISKELNRYIDRIKSDYSKEFYNKIMEYGNSGKFKNIKDLDILEYEEYKKKLDIIFYYNDERKRSFVTDKKIIFPSLDNLKSNKEYPFFKDFFISASNEAMKEIKEKIDLLISFKKIMDGYFNSKGDELLYENENVYILKGHINKKIRFDMLSSGEINHLLMSYELVFNTKDNTIVIIDEPENSQHIGYQSRMLDDFEVVYKNMSQMIIATHSPFIVGERIDAIAKKENLDFSKPE